MKKHLITLCSLLLALTGICGAQSATSETAQAGRSASTLMPDLTLKSSVTALVPQGTRFDNAEIRHQNMVNHVWIASLCAVAASTSLDAATSWGKREGNGFLASSDGAFGMRGVSIKAGMLAAVVIPQVIFRHHRDLRSKFAIGNFIEAGIFTGVSVHNLGVTAPR